MYDHRLLAVDLPTVVRVATARNIDIREAQQRVEASRGQYEASVGMIFPSITPNVTSLGIEGALASPTGLALATFSHTFPVAVLQWIINPGLVAYDIVASRRRLIASEQQDQAVVLETTRLAAVQYYDVVLAQAQVAVARRAMQEVEELLRIERLRLKTGTGLQADELRAEAALAGRRQDLLTALTRFYDASVALTLTLHLDPTVMLVPVTGTMRQTTLVREDLQIDDMLVTSVHYRPDLEAVRTLLAAADADRGAAIWGDSARRSRQLAPLRHGRPPTRPSIPCIGSRYIWLTEASTGVLLPLAGLELRPLMWTLRPLTWTAAWMRSRPRSSQLIRLASMRNAPFPWRSSKSPRRARRCG